MFVVFSPDKNKLMRCGEFFQVVPLCLVSSPRLPRDASVELEVVAVQHAPMQRAVLDQGAFDECTCACLHLMMWGVAEISSDDERWSLEAVCSWTANGDVGAVVAVKSAADGRPLGTVVQALSHATILAQQALEKTPASASDIVRARVFLSASVKDHGESEGAALFSLLSPFRRFMFFTFPTTCISNCRC